VQSGGRDRQIWGSSHPCVVIKGNIDQEMGGKFFLFDVTMPHQEIRTRE